MYKPDAKNLLLFAILTGLMLVLPRRGFPADPVVDTLVVRDGMLVMSYHLKPVLDDNTVNSLKRGAITRLSHQIQVWRDRPLINNIVREYEYPVQLSYDNWEHKFRIQMPGEDRLTSNLETIRKKCTQMQEIELIPVNDLEPDAQYCITIRVKFAPLSVDTYDAIRGVLPESNESQRRGAGHSGSIWQTALNLLGLGDKTFSLKTDNFRITSDRAIEYID
ncbi:MAG: DUF4390 domain-containing protein [candidate division KSB1 bacterium]|nr:DUF4390 domain-containing protein [candidate division KSB1 bacterium]